MNLKYVFCQIFLNIIKILMKINNLTSSRNDTFAITAVVTAVKMTLLVLNSFPFLLIG